MKEIQPIVYYLLIEGLFGLLLCIVGRISDNEFLMSVTKGWVLAGFSALLVIMSLTIIIGKSLQ